MNNHKREKDEYIERLYYMKEDGKNSINELKSTMSGNFDAAINDELLSEDITLATLTETPQAFGRTSQGTHRRIAEHCQFHDRPGGADGVIEGDDS